MTLRLLDKLIREREEQLARLDEEFKATEPFSTSLLQIMDEPNIADNLENLIRVVSMALDRSDAFFRASTERDIAAAHIGGPNIEFTSLLRIHPFSPERLHARQFGLQWTTSAILVIPHWNASPRAYDGICRALSLFGFRTLCLTLPHHGERGVPASRTANLFISANLGQTIQAIRQSVAETMQITAWLRDQGFRFIAVIGVSLGSCIASLVAAHDASVDAAVLALTGGDFAEAVWTGQATRHIRAALEGKISLDELRAAWRIISPDAHVERLAARHIPLMLIAGARDEVILPNITARYCDALKALHVCVRTLTMACGHYTLASLPFNLLALCGAVAFLRKGRRSRLGRRNTK